ncbi:MAG: energy transducer TonB [Pyrinomonadaceae bacterium]
MAVLRYRSLAIGGILLLLLSIAAAAQRIAVLTPGNEPESTEFAEGLETYLSRRFKLVDGAVAQSAFASFSPATPFNLTNEEAKKLGAAMGCNFFILLRAANQRRSSFKRPEYYEAYAAIYVVSARTGRLISWKLVSEEEAKSEKASLALRRSMDKTAEDIMDVVGSVSKKEIQEQVAADIEEVPDPDSPAARNFRSPVPYRRIKPEYTAQAALYDVTATVDLVVDLSVDGSILRTEVVRWAGYGLHESVEKTVRSMNWRPAERGGKPLPVRFLLRYNFKKIDKDKNLP